MQGSVIKERMTVDEFLSWEGEPGCRYELIDGEPVMMAPTTRKHGKLQGNLYVLLRNALQGSAYEVTMGPGVRRLQHGDRLFAPDVIICRYDPAQDFDRIVEDPILVAEVLSDSTEKQDRTMKLQDYRLMASIRHILLIDQYRSCVEHHHRTADGDWHVNVALGSETTVDLADLGVSLALTDLYGY